MSELSDLRLDKSDVAAPDAPGRRGLWILIIVVLVAIAAAGYVGWKRAAARRAAALELAVERVDLAAQRIAGRGGHGDSVEH
jgi:hypothetical protein